MNEELELKDRLLDDSHTVGCQNMLAESHIHVIINFLPILKNK